MIINLGKYEIGLGGQPFIIAEMSGNHNQSLEKALNIVEAAATAGAHALKIQTYTADALTLNIREGEFFINDKNSIWKGQSLYELYQQAYTPWDWHESIINKANELGMICFSTPFNDEAVDFLEDLNVPAYKIASFENIHLPLIRKVASTGKPMIISTGMANLDEIETTYKTAIKFGAKGVTLLYCVSNYPSRIDDFNLRNIETIKKKFKCEVGLSDHSNTNLVSTLSLSLGARIFEKHIALKGTRSLDSDFSLKGLEILEYRKNLDQSYNLIKDNSFKRSKDELKNKKLRCSIFSLKEIKKGEKFSSRNIRVIRPGFGLEPKFFEKIIGKKCKSNLKKNYPVLKKHI